MKKKLIYIFLLLMLSVPVVLPLLHDGFPVTDDGEWMIIRFSAFHQALRAGQFPVRFLGRLNYGYGYPVASFLYPGFMYLAEPLHLTGFGFIDSIKILIGASLVGSAVFTFLWLKRLFPSYLALTGAAVYLYSPYHLYDIFTRGSVGEILGFAVIPFVFWQIERKSFFWSVIGSALLILSHNTLALLFLPVIIFYKILGQASRSRKYLLLNAFSLILFTLGLTAFFWIPAILELPYTRFSGVQVAEWQRYFAEPSLIGYGSMIVAASMVLTFLRYRKLKRDDINNLALLFMSIGLIGVFMSYNYSAFIWRILSVSFVQFPYRFLSLLVPSAAFLTAYFLSQLRPFVRSIFFLVLLTILTVNILPFLKVQGYLPQAESLYATNEDSTTVKNEYMPKWVKEDPTEHFSKKVIVVKGEGVIEDVLYNSKNISFTAKTNKEMTVRINTIYYPGWNAFVNEKSSSIDYRNRKGLMELSIKENPANVKLTFSETPLRIVANAISVLSFIVLVLLSTSLGVKLFHLPGVKSFRIRS